MRRTREQWAALIAAFERTNQTARAFCERRGISPRTFAWWRWQLRETAPHRDDRDCVKLVAVDVLRDEAGARGATRPRVDIVLPGGIEVRADGGVDIDFVVALVARLRGT